VFNHVRNVERDKLEFNFSTVYVKRCVALPGDTLSIVDGFYRNSSAPGAILGIEEQQRRLGTADTLRLSEAAKGALKYTRPEHDWTIFDLGPLYVPKAGASVALDSVNYSVFRIVVEYETGEPLTCEAGNVYLGDSTITQYRFLKNYYFMAGDHAINSNDSRYWGFVPEEHIIGIAPRVLSSRDPRTGRFRWERFYNKLR
jgi:signal peptidase I